MVLDIAVEEKLKEIEQVSGLKEHLVAIKHYHGVDWTMGGAYNIIALRVIPERQAAAYILDILEWPESGDEGITYSAQVGVFVNGKFRDSGRFKYRDGHSSSGDNWHNQFDTIESFDVNNKRAEVAVSAPRYKDKKSFDFSF